MINAEEARAMAVEAAQTMLSAEMDQITSAITKAAAQGMTFTIYHDCIGLNMISLLKGLGYTVKDYSSQRDGYAYRIEW